MTKKVRIDFQKENPKMDLQILTLAIFIVLVFAGRTLFSKEHPASDGQPPRIKDEVLNRYAVRKIYLSEGLVSVLEFRDEVLEVRAGNAEIVKVSFSGVNKKELTLRLLTQRLGPTNLIVRAGRNQFVFDIIPSRKVHEDMIYVRGSVGAKPELQSQMKSGKVTFQKTKSNWQAPTNHTPAQKGVIR